MGPRGNALLLLGSLACGPVVAAGGDGTGSGHATVTGVDDPSAEASGNTNDPPGEPPPPSTMTTAAGTSSGTTAPGDDGVAFVQDPDGGARIIDCDPWQQDCPRGMKCAPWAGLGEVTGWHDARCVPVAADPKAVGETCTVVESAYTGLDDCASGTMCYYVDPETNTGECVALCHGSEAEPTCLDPCAGCLVNASGALLVCLVGCDPIVHDCGPGDACYWLDYAFVCAPDVFGDVGGIGDPCEFINGCDPGTFCADADVLPDCAGASGCCAPFCDAARADPCSALLPGTTCVPWFDPGAAPEPLCGGGAVIGACIVPP